MALSHPLGVIILAGGKSSRMGRDKGLMSLNGKPMVQAVAETARKVSEEILIIANDDAYQQFGFRVLKDDFHEKGPLAGIYTGLKNTGFDYNLVLSCDIPFIQYEALEFLANSCIGSDVTVSWSDGKLHPLVGVYHKNCMPAIEQRLQHDELQVMSLFSELSLRIVDMGHFLPENFRNINSPEDL